MGGKKRQQRLAPAASLGMDEPARLWLLKIIREQYWRVSTWIDLEDLIQDGHMCYQIVRTRYPQAIVASHVMSLFMRTFVNHLHQLANKRTKSILEVAYETLSEIPSPPCPNAEMVDFVLSAPPLVRECLRAIVQDPTVLNRSPDHWTENTTDWLARISGQVPTADLRYQTEQYLGRKCALYDQSKAVTSYRGEPDGEGRSLEDRSRTRQGKRNQTRR